MNSGGRAKRNRIAATEALRMAETKGQKIGIAVDDDAKGESMLQIVLKMAKKHNRSVGEVRHGDGVIYVPVGDGEIRIVSADHLVKPGMGLN